jgi:Uri superfamily endonuclease
VGLEARPGTYAFLLSSASDAEIRVGRFGDMQLQSGFYLYLGSALGPGGVRARVNHHLHASPRPHWHIDYLRPHASVEEVWLCHGRKRREHLWARFLARMPGVSVPMPGFGSSDCACEAHLFFFKSRAMRDRIQDALSAQGASRVCPQFVPD